MVIHPTTLLFIIAASVSGSVFAVFATVIAVVSVDGTVIAAVVVSGTVTAGFIWAKS